VTVKSTLTCAMWWHWDQQSSRQSMAFASNRPNCRVTPTVNKNMTAKWLNSTIFFKHHESVNCVSKLCFVTYLHMVSCSFLSFSKQATCPHIRSMASTPLHNPSLGLSWGHFGLALWQRCGKWWPNERMLACGNERSEQVLKQVCMVGQGCSCWVISHEVQRRRWNQNGRTHRTTWRDSGAWCT
jgi:hypothetical protein